MPEREAKAIERPMPEERGRGVGGVDFKEIFAEVVSHFEQSGRPLPPPTVRPMREVG